MWLHNFMLIICLVIFVAVFGVMFYSIFKHRKSKGAVSANFHESVGVEIAWTVVPFIIVILMALPATKVVVAMKDTTNADLTIKATGYQWKWGYDYLKGEGEGIGFLATLDATQREMSNAGKPEGDNYLLEGRQPAGGAGQQEGAHHHHGQRRDPRLDGAVLRRQAGCHSRLRARHLVPRRARSADFYGQCAELCGKEHAYMPIHVKVVSAEDYTAWVDGEEEENRRQGR